jgi:hypothetical protein
MLSLDRHETSSADRSATRVLLTLALARLHHAKDFSFAHSLDFRNWNIPFALEECEVKERFFSKKKKTHHYRFFFAFLFDRIRENFRSTLFLTI